MGKKKIPRIRINTAVKAIRIARKAMSMVAGEMKVLQTSGTATSIVDGVGTSIQLSNIGPGDTSILRDGNMILIKKIDVDLTLKMNAAATSSQVRILLVKDKQPNGAVVPVADLLEVTTNLLSILCPKNHNFMKRFIILYDKVHILDQNVTAVSSKSRHIHIKRKQNIKIQYDGVVGDITDVQTNSYTLILIGNEPTNEPTFDHFVRLSFIDN